MAEDARRRHGAVMDFFDVGRADAADGDLDEQFVRADARDGHGFEAQVVDAAINDGAHGFRDHEHGNHLATDETQMKHGFFDGRMRKDEIKLERTDIRCYKFFEPRFGLAGKFHLLSAPSKSARRGRGGRGFQKSIWRVALASGVVQLARDTNPRRRRKACRRRWDGRDARGEFGSGVCGRCAGRRGAGKTEEVARRTQRRRRICPL